MHRKSQQRSQSGSRQGPNCHYLHLSSCMGVITGFPDAGTDPLREPTFTEGLLCVRPWAGHLNLNVNVAHLEDTCASSD